MSSAHERRAEEYQPTNEFRKSLGWGFVFLAAGAAVSISSGRASSGTWMFVLAAINWIDAILIRTGLGKPLRSGIRIACAVATIGIWWASRP